MPRGDAKLPVEARRGDPAAFADLFARHEADLFRFTRYLAREEDLAEELYQETWLRVARRLRACDEMRRDDFRKWLFTVAANLFRDELRKRRIRRKVDGGSLDTETSTAGERTAAKTPEISEQIALREGLDRALGALSERQRTAFLLVHAEGFKLREVATVLEVAEGTVKSMLHRAAAIMREQLGEFRQ